MNGTEPQNKGWVVSAGITRRKFSSLNAGNVVRLVMVSVVRHGIDTRFWNYVSRFIGHLNPRFPSDKWTALEYPHAR